MKVYNMRNKNTGREIPHQFIIQEEGGTWFQSYYNTIAKIANGNVYLDENFWDYSTAGKYRNQFLGETKKETEAKIKNGSYILADLNKS